MLSLYPGCFDAVVAVLRVRQWSLIATGHHVEFNVVRTREGGGGQAG